MVSSGFSTTETKEVNSRQARLQAPFFSKLVQNGVSSKALALVTIKKSSTLKPFNQYAFRKLRTDSTAFLSKHSRKSFNYCEGAKYLNGVTKHVNHTAINQPYIYFGDPMLIQLKRFWKQLHAECCKHVFMAHYSMLDWEAASRNFDLIFHHHAR